MPKVTWNDAAILQIIQKKALDGCEELAYVIKTDAMQNCPVALINGGTLRASHGIERLDNEKRIVVGVGGAAAPYALVQHERLDYYHTTGEAKWLENAFQRHANELTEYIERHMR